MLCYMDHEEASLYNNVKKSVFYIHDDVDRYIGVNTVLSKHNFGGTAGVQPDLSVRSEIIGQAILTSCVPKVPIGCAGT